VEEMRANIEQLKTNIAEAKTRQAEASKDIKRIEKDMSEFTDNKDSKLAELEASLDKLKKSLAKNSGSVKELQKELQICRLDSEQAGSDLSAAEEQLVEADNTLNTQAEEIEAQKREQTRLKVCTHATQDMIYN
jgi:structural maintenance of chromosome 2